MRPSPGAAPTLPKREDGLVRETRTYQFLTPVFGGGVKLPAEDDDGRKLIDRVTPVRVPSIRGQLRFWWRAANPRGCATVEELYQAEVEIFGGLKWKGESGDKKPTTRRSALQVHVVAQPRAPGVMEVFVKGEKFRTIPGMDAIAYGAFPLRATNANLHGALHDFGSSTFELAVTYPEHLQRDVHAALWAWSSFGGLGGRTRRGFGAIADVTKPSSLRGVDEGWRKYVTGKDVEWPHLPPQEPPRVASVRAHDGLSALKTLLGKFKDLRQGVRLGRNQGQQRREGRSFWPEPDAIRQITGSAAASHRERMTPVDAFPRAAFGMPIIFHFKDRADPRDTTLQPREDEVDRFASPLILRPYRDAHSGDIAAMALELKSVLPEAELKGGRGAVKTKLSENEARQMKRPPRAEGLFPQMFHDPIGAYLNLLEGKS